MLGNRRDNREFESKGSEFGTIIGKDAYLDGVFEVDSSVRIDGRVKGRIKTHESLIVGKNGEVDGEVTTRDAIIGGTVRHKVQATGKVVLEKDSVFQGELEMSKLVIDEGANFQGTCKMGAKESVPQPKRKILKTAPLAK